MSEKIGILFHSNSKVWAFAMEMAVQLKNPNNEVFLIDVTKISRPSWISFRRKKFQRFIASSHNIKLVNYKRNYLQQLYLIINLIKQYKTGKKMNKFPGLEEFETNYSEVVHCRISAYLGVKDYEFEEVSLKVFLRHSLIANCMENFFHKKLSLGFTKFIVYNGREPISSTLIKLAQEKGVSIVIGERGSSNSKYQIFPNSPHFHPDWWHLINAYHNKNLINSKSSNAIQKFKENKLRGHDTYFSENWNLSKNNNIDEDIDTENYILYLTSSSTEFSPFSKFNSKLGFQNQFEAVKILAKICEENREILMIRRHPNSIGVDGVDREFKSWLPLKNMANVIYVGPHSEINSYELVKKAKSVFVWKSSIGFETLTMKKPTYALGPAKWAWEEIYQCWTVERMREVIKFPIYPKITDNVIEKYAFFMSTSGERYQLFTIVEKWGVELANGERIYNLFGERLRSKVINSLNIFFKRRTKRNA